MALSHIVLTFHGAMMRRDMRGHAMVARHAMTTCRIVVASRDMMTRRDMRSRAMVTRRAMKTLVSY